MIKADVLKAYDSVHWEFLEYGMKFLNFPPLLISWIMECVRTTKYSILVNGEPVGFFGGQRGQIGRASCRERV